MFERLGSLSYRFRYLIVLAWVLGAVASARLAPSLASAGATDQATFLPAYAPSMEARDAIERAFPGATSASAATLSFSRDAGLTDADRAYVADVAAWVTSADAPAELRDAVTGTESATSRPELERMLRSDDGQLELLVVNLDIATAGGAGGAVVAAMRGHLAATAPEGLATHVTGTAGISSDYLDAIRAGTDSTTLVTIILVLVVLLLIYRAPLAALVPLVTIGGAFVVSRGILGLLAAAGWQVSSLLDTFLVVLVFGVGTDYAIFLISRYREEVARGDWHDASRVTVGRIGAVISASAATVIVGMGAMAFADFEMIQSTGPALGVAIFVTLVAGLTLAPALLSIFGHYLFWPLHGRTPVDGEPGGFFARLAALVSHRPGLVTVTLLIALLIPAAGVPQMRTNFDVLSELPPASDARAGFDDVATHLGRGKLVQSTGLVEAGGGDMLAPATLTHLRDVMAALSAMPGVSSATSLVTPDGDGIVPDGFRPSKQLAVMADELAGDDGEGGDVSSSALLKPEVGDGLASALSYVEALSRAYPEVGAGAELRAVTATIGKAQDIVERVRTQSVLSTQLRTLAAAMTSPASMTGSDSSTSIMGDYLDELAGAYPEVRALPAFGDGVAAAAALEREATIGAAVDLARAFEALAIHFDDQPEARLSPASLAGTSSARELKREAKAVFGALPDDVAALGAVFETRPDDVFVPVGLGGDDAAKLDDAVAAFVSGDRTATRFYVTTVDDPYSPEAFATIRSAQALLADVAPGFGRDAATYLGGPTAQFSDVQTVMNSDFGRVGVVTVLGILLVLVVLLRAVVAPLYLVGTVLVSYGSAVGLSSWLFQDVLGQPGVSFYLPLMVFVLLVALGSDYNIFLMSRVREESATRPIRDGIRIASGHTGAVITSAGLILAGTFGSMASAPLAVLFQVGVAVAIGVLIDTFVVRSILVPAITTLVGDLAWWPSAALARWSGARLVVAPGSAAIAGAGFGAGPMPRRARGRLAVSLGLVLLLPLVVAGLLSWSIGSSASGLASVRAAVVNLDQGATMPAADGSSLDLRIGADLAAALTAPPATPATALSGDFTWVATDEADAASGLADGRYAAVLTIPPTFSRSIAAIRTDSTGRSLRATLHLATDDGSSEALGMVARSVSTAITTATARGVAASYVGDVLLAVSDARAAVTTAAGAARDVAGGSSDLASDAAGVQAEATLLVAGLEQLAAGATDAREGTDRLVSGTRSLASGAKTLADGAEALAAGARAAASGADQLADGTAGVADGLAALDASVGALPGQASALAAGASEVAAGAAGVSAGATSLADGLSELRSGTTGLGAQATALHDGAAALSSGAVALAGGAGQAAGAAADLADGADQLAASIHGYTGSVAALAAACPAMGGSAAVCDQLALIAASGGQLVAGADGVATGATQLSAAAAGVASGAADVRSGAAGLEAGTGQLAASAPALEAGIVQSAAGAAELAAGTAALTAGAETLASGAGQLAAGMPALADGIAELSDGAAALKTGAATAADGLHDLALGADRLARGVRATAKGAAALASGTSGAADGIEQLTGALSEATDGARLVEAGTGNLADRGSTLDEDADGLATDLSATVDGIPVYTVDTRARIGEIATDPIALETEGRGATGGPAATIAPFVMALGLWLAGLGAFLVLPGLWVAAGRRWWREPLWALAAAAAVVVAGGLLMAGGLQVLVGVEIANVAALLGFVTLSAVAFVAILQALVVLFGARGWLAGLLLTVLQAAAAGFPYPPEALPGPVAALHPFLPMTYAVESMRAAVSGGGSAVVLDAAVLGAWLVMAVLVTLAAAAGAAGRDGEAVVVTAG